MVRRLIIFLLIIFVLVGCSSKTKEVDNLIAEGKYPQAVKLIKDNDLLKQKDENSKYNYKSLVSYNELKKLYEQKKYWDVLEKYTTKPIKDKYIKNEVLNLLNGSFEYLIKHENYYAVRDSFNKLDKETQNNLTVISDKLVAVNKQLQKKQKQQEKIEQKSNSSQVSSLSPMDQYLKYMKEGNYAKLAEESTEDLTIVGENFFNLSEAYNSFYNNNDIIYIEGEDSLPETFLNNIGEPLPEVVGYISKLKKEIEDRKKGSKGKFGVSAGMTKDVVLKSSWGKPQKINTTTSASGNREQWVYGNGNYLYFENDILVSIQTSR